MPEHPQRSYIDLSWTDRAFIGFCIIAVATFLWGVQELRIQRAEERRIAELTALEERVFLMFSFEAQLETIRLNHYRLLHSHCGRFSKDRACEFMP